MTSRRIAILMLGAIAGAMIGVACNDDGDDVKPADQLPAPTFGDATISGTVRFVGTPPPLAMVDTKGTCLSYKPIQEETIVIGREGGLRDVVVWLDDAPASNGAGQPSRTLDQVGCRYVPHVLGVQVGQPLTIRSSDPEVHNVHWTAEKNPGENLSFTAAGQTKAVAFRRAEFLKLRCDIHPWMESFVAVMPNPFFAVTGADGRFDIPRVPGGTYHLRTWHPILGERTGTATVSGGGSAAIYLEYARPTPRN